jgi:hypothetical protein
MFGGCVPPQYQGMAAGAVAPIRRLGGSHDDPDNAQRVNVTHLVDAIGASF